MQFMSLLSALLLLFPVFADAAITKIVVEKREPFAGGYEFGVSGAYEKLVGKAYGEVDPKKKHDKRIVNLDRAPKNERGRVEYSMDIFILKPVDMKRGNQTIFYEVVNRGNQALRVNYGAERSNNPGTLAHAGDGFMGLPGGIGTMEEFFEVLSWAQLSLHEKPCGLLNTRGYYDHVVGFLDHAVEEGFLKMKHRSLLIVEAEPEKLVDGFEAFIAARAPHRFERRQT